jgi:hypothetical protein
MLSRVAAIEAGLISKSNPFRLKVSDINLAPTSGAKTRIAVNNAALNQAKGGVLFVLGRITGPAIYSLVRYAYDASFQARKVPFCETS